MSEHSYLNRRKLIKYGGLASATGVLGACSNFQLSSKLQRNSSGNKVEKVVASWLPIMQATAYYVALEEKLFEKAGLEIESAKFENPNQIVEVYVKRANSILDSLEATDSSEGPVLDEDFLSGLMRQSMSIDLSDLMEEFAFDEVESSPVIFGSQVALIDRKEARAIARQERARMRKALKELAEKENIPLWQQAIASWIEQHQGEKVSLLQLQQVLGMPLVEVWLGLLHSPTPSYQWDGTGEFYQEVGNVWIYKS